MKKIYPICVISILAVFFAGIFLVKINEDAKNMLVLTAKRIKKEIYKEAGMHNPKGDLVPDDWDDAIIKEIEKQI